MLKDFFRLLFITMIVSGTVAAKERKSESNDTDAVIDTLKTQETENGTLDLPVVRLVKSKATGFGMYEARSSNHFKSGETIRFYIEPRNFKYKKVGDVFTFGVSMDLVLKSKGKEVFRKEKFLDSDFRSYHQNKELMLNGDLDISGAAPGEYLLEQVVHDHWAADIARAQLAFVLD